MLFIGKLVSTYTEEIQTMNTPTLSNPNITDWKQKKVILNVSEVWYYNKTTGEIYYKQKSN